MSDEGLAEVRHDLLDGRVLVMESSTASAVDPTAPTRFWYHETGGLVWGAYVGDTVTEGRFVGRRTGRVLTVQFIHALASDGSLVSGSSTSTIVGGDVEGGTVEGDDVGGSGDVTPIRLVEDFVIDGHAHVSVCVEVADGTRTEEIR